LEFENPGCYIVSPLPINPEDGEHPVEGLRALDIVHVVVDIPSSLELNEVSLDKKEVEP